MKTSYLMKGSRSISCWKLNKQTGSTLFGMMLLMLFALTASAQGGQKPSASLEQARNGSVDSPRNPIHWVNGNAGHSNAHYRENHSIPYRVVMHNLPVGEEIWIEIEYDTKHSNRHAIDFLTHYDHLYPHDFDNHSNEELVQPWDTVFGGKPGDEHIHYFLIPQPGTTGTPVVGEPANEWQNHYDHSNGGEHLLMTGFYAVIDDIEYVDQESLAQSQASTSLRIYFKATQSTAVLAWGGHIAAVYYWGTDDNGVPYSAGGISGSPYHMRLLDWNLNNLGNQDRSLSAAAIIVECTDILVDVPDKEICDGESVMLTATASGGVAPYEFSWYESDGVTELHSETVNAEPYASTYTTDALSASTSYIVRVTDAQVPTEGPDCMGESTVTVTVYDNPDLTDATDEFCEDEYSSTALSDYNSDIGAAAGDDVVWYSDAARTSVVTHTGDLGEGEHEFYATVTNDDGCDADAMLTVTIYAAPVCIASNDGAVCAGDAVQLYESGGSAVAWSWTSNGSATFDDPNAQNPVASGVADGEIFYVTVTDVNNCISTCETTVYIEPCIITCETAYAMADGAACFLDNGFSNWGWTNKVQPGDYFVMPLYAGAAYCEPARGWGAVGTVTVDYSGNEVTVTYNTSGSGYALSEVHTNVGCEMFASDKKGSPTIAPGQYTYVNSALDKLEEFKVTFDNVNGPVWLIAHAVVCDVQGNGSLVATVSDEISCGEEKSGSVSGTQASVDLKAGDLKVYPNPFSDRVVFEFTSPNDARAVLEITNMLGQHVVTLIDKQVQKGVMNRVEFRSEGVAPGNLIYRLRLNDEVMTGRLIYKE